MQAQPQAGFVFGDQWFVDEQDRILFRQTGDPDYVASIACGMPSIPHPATFVRAEVYRRYGGFDETYRTAMDYELLLRFHRAGVKGWMARFAFYDMCRTKNCLRCTQVVLPLFILVFSRDLACSSWKRCPVA